LTSLTFLGLQQNSGSDFILLTPLRNLEDLNMDELGGGQCDHGYLKAQCFDLVDAPSIASDSVAEIGHPFEVLGQRTEEYGVGLSLNDHEGFHAAERQVHHRT
jgi:hypothetical protein